MTADIGREVAALNRLSIGRLRERYAEAFGEPPASSNRAWLARRIAWRLQERAYGGLSERAKRRAAELADDADLRVVPPRAKANAAPVEEASPPHDPRLPAPGTVLTRAYKGKTLEVKVLSGGFEFRGERYASLSAVAKAITGSHLNGFAFFGLTVKRGAR
ncbi:MAG TPA: DUF2924 domain-containing protein [Gemmataceae bacterium]|jgi:hypothetical protein|nr:DUF2924 domain-containing protein [Gemmataceae bacterium]